MTPSIPRRRSDAIRVLRTNPAFARVYVAQLVSYGGDWFSTVALQGLILHTTGSAFLASLMLAAQLLPGAFAGPFAGVVADRFDRKVVMISADVVRALIALTLLFAHSRETLWIAFVCVGAMSTLAAFFNPSSSAALPNLVSHGDLPTATVMMGSTWGTMLAVGAMAGGIVAATLGREAAFIGDALSFAISAALLASARGSFATNPRNRHKVSILDDISEMIRFARGERRVGYLLVVKTGFGFATGTMAMISVMAVSVFKGGEGSIGVLMSARGIGALTGPFIFRRIFGTHDRGIFRAVATAFVVFGAGYALLGAAPTLGVAAIGICFAHIGGASQWTMSTLGFQRFTPDHIRGRVFSADHTLVSLTMSVSMVLAGSLTHRYGARAVVEILACLSVLWSLVWTALTHHGWPPAGLETPDPPPEDSLALAEGLA